MIILSILIPTIPSRSKQFNSLLIELKVQKAFLETNHPSLGQIQILFDDSKRYLDGGKSIGQKRNDLLQLAKGMYLCFMDDDDNIAPNYLETLVRLCHKYKDVVTFRTIFKNDNYWTLLDLSLAHKVNEECAPGKVVRRTVWHICPIKSEIAKKYAFSDLNHNEDWTWMEQVLTEVKTEVHTDMILTQYNHSEVKSEADLILKDGHK